MINEEYQIPEDVLTKTLKYFGITNYTNIGSENNGTAYDIGNNKVLKITSDENEAKSANYVRHLSNALKHVITVYNVHKVGNYYAIILEKITPLEPKLYDDWNEIQHDFLNYNTTDETLWDIIKKKKINPKFAQDIINQRKDILKEVKRFHLSKIEIHRKNIGFADNGNFIIFDLKLKH
jgi:hypothetical protein